MKTETCLCDLPGHFGIDGFEEAFVGGVSHICIVKSGKIGALEHTFHCVEIKALDAGKIFIQFFGWLAAFVEIVANGCAGDKDKNKQKQNASGLSFSFFLRNRVFIWHI